MLDVVFFPFSHISDSQLKTLLAIFPSFRYLPLASCMDPDYSLFPMIEQGRVQPVFHSPEELIAVDSQVKSYRAWAQMHRGNERNLKTMLRDRPYFTDDSDLTRIQSQLRGMMAEDPAPEEKKRQENPLLFLKFAELFDAENEKIDEQLCRLEQNRTHLFSQLTGVPRDGSGQRVTPRDRDPGEGMTGQRIRSWCRAAREKGVFENQDVPLVLVTTSPAVFDHFLSGSKDVINGLDIESIKVHEDACPLRQKWQEDISDLLENGLRDRSFQGKELLEPADGCQGSAGIRLEIFPEEPSFLDLPDLNSPGKSMGICLVRLTPHKKLDFP